MAAVLNGAPYKPTAHLQIKYVCRLPDTRTTSPFFSSLRARATTFEAPMTTATVSESHASQSWKITAIVRNTSSQNETRAIKIYSWPMFAPEESQLVASAGTTTSVPPAQSGSIEVEVPKRDLAHFNERTGKWVLEEGIYMFEIKATEDPSTTVGTVKQVSVLEKLEWCK